MASFTTKGKDGSNLLSYSYRYDRNGNRVEKKDNAKNNHTTYAYDSMQRLCEVTYPETGKETYTYDAVGNRIRKQTESYVEGYIYDERNRLKEKSVWENGASVPVDTTTYTYDAQGSLLSEQGSDLCRKYLYNDLHQCISTEIIRGREEEAERILQENRYDGEGLRFSLIENGKRTDFITNGWDNLTELDESGQVTKRIIRGMGIGASEDVAENAEAMEATGNIIDATASFAGTTAYHYYHGNERMDVEYITDEAGKVVNGYTYDAFGTIVTSSEKLQNRYTYNGEAFDKTTEQYYLRKRFYNPKLSRFIQEDEYRGDGLNLYAFCANNPVMYVDPSGYVANPGDYSFVGPLSQNELKAYYSNIRAYQGDADISKIPYEYRATLETIIEMNFKGQLANATNSAGWERNAKKYFKELNKIHPEYFSPDNQSRIKNNKSPEVDAQFIEYFPQYASYDGDKLIHHHIGGGGQVYAVPESLHPGDGGVHNYEKLAGVTDNDYLTEIAQSIEDGNTNKRKKSKKCS